MIRRLAALSVPICLILVLAPAARAGLSLSVANATIAAGQDTVDVAVYVTSDASSYDLQSFGLTALLTPNAGTATELAFDSTQPVVTNDPAGPFGNYLFAGDSVAAADGLALGGPTTSFTNYPGDTFVGIDSRASGNDILLAPNTTRLLAILQLTRSSLIPAGDGDTFTLSIVPSSSPSPQPGDPTFFADSMGNLAPFAASTDPTMQGQITVLGSGAAVPEPASLLSATLGLALLGLGVRANAARRCPRSA